MGFFRVAESLEKATDEAEQRTLVGRAYYALFMLARDRFYPTWPPPRRVLRQLARGRQKEIPIHTAVVDEVAVRDKTAGWQLQQLKDLRHEADYYPRPSRSQYADWAVNAARALQIARAVLPKIQRMK